MKLNKTVLVGGVITVAVFILGLFTFLLPTSKPDLKTGPTTIEITNSNFSPAQLIVAPGEKITVTNRDTIGHSVTSMASGLFDSGILNKDASSSIFAPKEPGTYQFNCLNHPSMRGTMIVK